jgi:hypothetical protein
MCRCNVVESVRLLLCFITFTEVPSVITVVLHQRNAVAIAEYMRGVLLRLCSYIVLVYVFNTIYRFFI